MPEVPELGNGEGKTQPQAVSSQSASSYSRQVRVLLGWPDSEPATVCFWVSLLLSTPVDFQLPKSFLGCLELTVSGSQQPLGQEQLSAKG